MALTKEDGTIVASANSYVTVADVRAFAALRGNTDLPADNPAVEALVIKAMDYVESYGSRFKGHKYSRDQELQWPRSLVWIGRHQVYSSEIPKQLKDAVCQLAIDASDIDIDPNGTGQGIVREKIGPLETEYIASGAGNTRPQLNKFMKFFRPLLKNGGGLLNTVTRG